jgi:hypothetical protein
MVTSKKNKKELWESINEYHFDNLVPVHLVDRVREMFGGSDHSTRAFASKLNRKLGWTTEFALRAIKEYKRFVYLGVISMKNVTPSKVIDQVWHEHQLFTKGYRDFCREVIGKDFDHTPELVPIPEQTLLFNQQYLDTLALYRTEFNLEPPADIWAVPKFNQSLLPAASSLEDRQKRNRNKASDDCLTGTNDSPLYVLVDTFTDGVEPSSGFHGFGGGTSGGAGATGHWSTPSHAPAHSHSSTDTGHSGHGSAGGHGDGGHSSDSSGGGSDGGGSSCSSSCGGGGCGGGGCGGS